MKGAEFVDLNKLTTADRVILVAGIVFLVAMFLPWYGLDFGSFGSASNTGWDYFLTGILPLLLVIVMVGQIAITRFSTTELPALPLPWAQVHLIAGAAVAVLLILRVIITSEESGGGITVELDREWGLWVALVAAIGVGVGGFLKSQEGEDAVSGTGAAPPTPF
jgi:hypothetical protein